MDLKLSDFDQVTINKETQNTVKNAFDGSKHASNYANDFEK